MITSSGDMIREVEAPPRIELTKSQNKFKDRK
jgi:hypothetical protein